MVRVAVPEVWQQPRHRVWPHRASLGLAMLLALAAAGQSGCSAAPEDSPSGDALLADGSALPDGGGDARQPEGADSEGGDRAWYGPWEPPAADLRDALSEVLSGWPTPAMAVAVLEGGSLTALGAAGRRKADDPTAVTRLDRWHLGSCTKAMTATLAALLVADGLLGWDTTLPELFSEMVGIDAGYQAVTLAQLLAHRGGAWGDVTAHPDVWSVLWTDSSPVTDQRLWFAEQVLSEPPEVAPGTFLYSNAGYMVAGAALEQASGQPWEQLLRERLWQPLGIVTCGFGAPATPPDLLDEPWGHQGVSPGYVPVAPGPYADNPPALGPAGTAHCDLIDWARFGWLHIAGHNGWPLPAGIDLGPADFAILHTAPGDNYALGWGVIMGYPWAGGGPVLQHNGSNTMFYASLWLAPAVGRGYLLATNAADATAQQALQQALSRLLQ